MEKPILCRKFYKQLWCVTFCFFFCFFVLFCFDYLSLISGKNGVTTLLVYNFAINNQRCNHHLCNINETITYNPDSSEVIRNFTELDSCSGKYIYVHDLPIEFNDNVLSNCSLLVKWFDMCPFTINSGLGPQVRNPGRVLMENCWFATNQFLLEVIFRNRMNQYKCLTKDSTLASAIYVPFYAGLDIGRYLWGYNISMRDSSALDLVKWLAQKPEWKKMWGIDHFFVAGRIGWDFQRQKDNDSYWGSKLMLLPESMNMTMLSIEATSWSNEIAIPYPTYFHPSSDAEVFQWQDRLRSQKRRYLFAFAGAPRPSMEGSIREEIIKQCIASKGKCKLLDCNSVGRKCDKPVEVIKVFQKSVFCLQPPGDSYTRRSTFDSILAGCIPVFFHPGSAYAQYLWHLPKDYKKYSVFIPENNVKNGKVSIKQSLLHVSKDQVLAMREEVIRLIPRVIYANPSSKLETIEDAFDIAVKGILDRVEHVRREFKKGMNPSIGFAQENWKLKLREHEWINFF
ncbi:Exostosin domain-containing protein [Cephalotus follicularis]|uniref:Exostosin domain-containing protein n=1 Tax=Cephalotus follicularis TaxID=3775 RepID=A0A1Q3DDR7_CEPFO|nr:Exostosin domain-containing protein [Cephalotus follicularis]